MTAKIAGLTRFHEKGGPGESMSGLSLLKGVGIEGDFHQGGERQISILSAENRRWMDAQTEKGLCFKKFHENILIEGPPFECRLLSIGKVVLRIITQSKPCYGECGLLHGNITCRLSGSSVFAAVEQGGTIHLGDIVKYAQ